MRTLRIDAATAEVVGALRNAGVPSILLKGPSVPRWIYDVASRPYGDCDLLVPRSDVEASEQSLRSLGFERGGLHSIPGDWPRHAAVYRRGDVVVDLHQTLLGVTADGDRFGTPSLHIVSRWVSRERTSTCSIPRVAPSSWPSIPPRTVAGTRSLKGTWIVRSRSSRLSCGGPPRRSRRRSGAARPSRPAFVVLPPGARCARSRVSPHRSRARSRCGRRTLPLSPRVSTGSCDRRGLDARSPWSPGRSCRPPSCATVRRWLAEGDMGSRTRLPLAARMAPLESSSSGVGGGSRELPRTGKRFRRALSAPARAGRPRRAGHRDADSAAKQGCSRLGRGGRARCGASARWEGRVPLARFR
jgi:Uncharacterised nucleotidyltransferase